ncbi:hypothetical protein Hanom_Chr07g00612421 [Helianthus anomalus]
MGARKDLFVSYSLPTQEEVEIDQCPAGSIALYCYHLEFSNLRQPFSVFVLNVLAYYRVSFGYDPSLLLFHRFFQLAKNDDWFTFETSHVDVFLISSMVTTIGSWKDRFFWVSMSIVPFKLV